MPNSFLAGYSDQGEVENTDFLIHSLRLKKHSYYYKFMLGKLNKMLQFSHSVVSDTLRPHESQHAKMLTVQKIKVNEMSSFERNGLRVVFIWLW